MMMSRKDYEAIAEAIKSERENQWREAAPDSLPVLALRSMAQRVARVFEADNPRFDRGRFLRACGF
jgi:hypothetical protein